MENKIKLTKLASCSGCGAKVGAGTLAKLISDIKVNNDENLIVGFDKSDDAAVYKIDDNLAIVQTVDFFPPIVDDPYQFGQIAAANALSDIYAMGATPKTALNIMMIPKDLDDEYTHQILKGGYDKVFEAGAVIAGGHSIYDDEPKYGLSVTGFVKPDKLLTNNSAEDGDVLIYTKPLGIGIMTTAIKAGIASDENEKNVVDVMKTLNKYACEIMLNYDVHSCTDVTGFSMIGHSLEMAQGSNINIVIDTKALNVLEGTFEYAKMGFIPEGAYRNRKFAEKYVRADGIPVYIQDVLYDPQTSGGLLIAVSKEDSNLLFEDLRKNNIDAVKIAQCKKHTEGEYVILV